ncbi:histidine phosphatase family protein [Ekhidna sp.]|jgi:phosphohistidine phosphatase|uniref:SixA phosphatase family protein n=1 Tax=Ekhidna sp. TaxID=2608089 RepID=UPI0032ECC19C
MSKTLYLIRHSYAEKPSGNNDEQRHLTLEGQSTVRALGRHLINQNFNPDIILCSSSVRTRETAVNLVEELEISEQVVEYKDIIYNASVRELLQVLNELSENHNEVAIIGHNPTITFFGEYLSNSIIGNMEPAGIVTIKIDKLNWSEVSQGTGIFESYYHPNH